MALSSLPWVVQQVSEKCTPSTLRPKASTQMCAEDLRSSPPARTSWRSKSRAATPEHCCAPVQVVKQSRPANCLGPAFLCRGSPEKGSVTTAIAESNLPTFWAESVSAFCKSAIPLKFSGTLLVLEGIRTNVSRLSSGICCVGDAFRFMHGKVPTAQTRQCTLLAMGRACDASTATADAYAATRTTVGTTHPVKS